MEFTIDNETSLVPVSEYLNLDSHSDEEFEQKSLINMTFNIDN